MTEAADFASKKPRVTFQNIPDFENVSTIDPPENVLVDNLTMRPRSLSHHLSSTKVPSRKWLKVRANFWRSLMNFAMNFHGFAPPRPPKAAFVRKIATDTIPIELYFYVPPSYQAILRNDPSYCFPAVVNFHGGGFCLGHATDDRYWARVVTCRAQAILISVNYRRAPEHPFPIPVDDSVEALLYIASHAPELHIDPSNVALSGFSAGGNLAFTVPLRLAYHKRMDAITSPKNEDTNFDIEDSDANQNTPSQSTVNLLNRQVTNSPLVIRSIIAWYPLLDWTTSRSQKKRESRNPEKTLPKVFTDLFDYSYLPPPDPSGNHCSPYASPGLAPDHMINNGLPHDIQIWLCEWDMLLREGQVFADRLDNLGKNVESKVIPRVPHGWDKSPNPFRDQHAIDTLYEKSARGLIQVFAQDATRPKPTHSPASSLSAADSLAARQPRRSVIPL